ncbi:MAG: toll/interleukin-1 receptor domain-containing protein [Bacteroidota bacterium]
MKDQDWNILIDNIQKGKCILVLGPEMASMSNGEETKSILEHFSNHLIQQIDDDPESVNSEDLEEVVEHYLKEKTEDELDFVAKNFFDKNFDEKELYDDLVDIPFKLIINASPDKSLIKTFEKKELVKGTDYFVDYYNHKGTKQEHAQWDDESKTMIFYLYGSPENWDSVVYSEMHLLDFLLSIISQTPALQSNISSMFCDDKTSFVFLGFGFQNWYLRILLYTLLGGKEVQKGPSRRLVALEKMMKSEPLETDQITVLFKNKIKIRYPDLNMGDFVTELKNRCEAVIGKRKKSDDLGIEAPKSIEIAGAPSVFICHASEDKEKAREIYNRLKIGKLNPVLDKELIGAGDNWNHELETAIKEVDYFIVVQSRAMASKTRGYVNKEISLALELSTRVRTGFSYLFPVEIETGHRLKELEKFQSIDLTDMNKIGDLIRAIRRDWERLKK